MSPSESGQQVSRLRELSEAAANEPQYPRGPWPTSVVLELIDIADQERAAREAAEDAQELMATQFRTMQQEKDHGWREAERFEDERDALQATIDRVREALFGGYTRPEIIRRVELALDSPAEGETT